MFLLSSEKAEPSEYSFFRCIEVTCHREWGGIGPDTVVVKYTGDKHVGWKCAEWDREEIPPECDSYRPFGGDWFNTVYKYGIEPDDDYTECWCSNRELVVKKKEVVEEKDVKQTSTEEKLPPLGENQESNLPKLKP